MAISGLTSGAEYLRNAAQEFFDDLYGNPKMHLDTPLHNDLQWTPALRFTIHGHINVFVEASETSPYPVVLKLKVAAVRNFPQPIAIYTICPKDVFLDRSKEAVQLQKDGIGLITVNMNGQANREFSTIPLIQIISKLEFKNETRGLPSNFRQRLSEAFEDYANKPVNGVKSVTEIVEGMVMCAGVHAVKKRFLQKSEIKYGTASTLDAMYASPQLSNARAAIGGVRNYNYEYRNISHHWPKSKNQAHKKYAKCRHAFLEGIYQIQNFRKALRNVGISAGLH